MDYRTMITDIVTSLGRQVITLARGIVLIPLITKLMAPGSYGIWATVLGVVSIVSGVGSLDLGNALVRYTPDERAEGEVFFDLLLLVSLTGTATVGVLLLLDRQFEIIPSTSAELMLAAAALILLRSFEKVTKTYPQARNQVKVFESLNTAQIVAETVGLAVFFYVSQDLVVGLWTLAVISLVVNVGTVFYYRPTGSGIPELRAVQTYLTYSIPIMVKMVSHRVIRHADKYLLLYLVSPTAVSVYAICTTTGKVVEDLGETVNPTLYPNVIQAWRNDDIESLGRTYTTIFRWFTILGLPAVVGLGILARPLLATISTTSIADQGLYLLPVTAAAFLIGGFNSPLQFIINAAERNELLSNTSLAAAVANIALNVLLIPEFGIFGAAAATIISYSMITFYLLYWTRTRVPFRLSAGTFAKSLLSVTVMASTLLLIPLSPTYPVQLVVYPIVGAIIYFAAMVLIGGIEREEFEHARRILGE
jgi:O-antigen/teichoic acid export membrane protein